MIRPCYQEAYNEGVRLRVETLSDQTPDHQSHVEAHWKNALTEWIASEKAFREPMDSYAYREHLRLHGRAAEQTGDFCWESVFTVHERSAFLPYRHVVRLEEDDCCDIIRFLAAHFDWPPDRILTEIKGCCETVSRKKAGPDKGGRELKGWGRAVFLLLMALFWILLLIDLKNSPFLRGMLIFSFPVYLAAFLCRQKAEQSIQYAIRTASDPASALELLCDAYASPLVRYHSAIARAADFMPLIYLVLFVIQRFLSSR